MRKAKRVPLSEMDVLKASLSGKLAVAAEPPDSPDEALARRHHDALLAALGPVMAALDAARADGYDLGFAFAPNSQGNQELQRITVTRAYRFQ